MNAIETQQAVCFWLINEAVKANADLMKLEQINVTNKGKSLGDWEIVVKKIEK